MKNFEKRIKKMYNKELKKALKNYIKNYPKELNFSKKDIKNILKEIQENPKATLIVYEEIIFNNTILQDIATKNSLRVLIKKIIKNK